MATTTSQKAKNAATGEEFGNPFDVDFEAAAERIRGLAGNAPADESGVGQALP